MRRHPAESMLHGGDLERARRAFPGAPEPWIDLSTGLNPEPYPVPELSRRTWAQLPQPDQMRALMAAAARRYGATAPDMVVAGPGTQTLIGLLPRLMAPTRVAVLGPTYGEHAVAWRREGHEVREVRDLAGAGEARVVVLVNPDNPTGRIVPTGELRRLAASLAARGGFIVVDEAFADVAPAGVSLVPELPPGAIVLRSFGKTYGLAGVRLGFAIAHPETAQQLRDRLGPWPVSGPALAVGAQALADDRWLERTREKLASACRRLDALLTSCGCVPLGGTPLFRLVAHPAAARMAETLARRGILVRTFPHEPAWLRFGLPGPEAAWQRLADALAAAHGTSAGDAAAL